MKQIMAYQFRLYPNKEQQVLITKTFGSARFIYNTCLTMIKNNKYISKFDMFKEIPNISNTYQFLKEVDSMVLRNSISDLYKGIDKYLKKQANYPNYKKKGNKESYRTSYITSTYKGKKYSNIKLDLINKTITLPKLKEIKISGYRKLNELDGRIINATVKQIGNKYYVSLCVERNIILPTKKENNIVGIDIGIKNLVTTSDNNVYGNPNYIKKYEKRIKILNKSLSRKNKGSKNYIKTLNKLKEVYRKQKNARKKTVEDIVSKIVKQNDIIVAEKLKIKDMIEKKRNKIKSLRKNIINSTFGYILKQLEYKTKILNKTFYQVNTYYPSSQTCCCCNNIDKSMKDINKRIYGCKKCKNIIDRDLNASINIMLEGLNIYYKEKYNF